VYLVLSAHLSVSRIGSLFRNAARFAYCRSWLRVTCQAPSFVLVPLIVATYCQINVRFRQELALSDDFSWLCFPRARENRSD
jgi:hypothetical protein